MKSLVTTLKYKNPEIIRRIQRTLNIEHQKAKAVFTDTLRWLWLCAKQRDEKKSNPWLNKNLPGMRMPSSWLPIDIGWHEFILCTREYTEFCEKYLDGYIHHKPALINNRLKITGKPFEASYLEVFYTFCGNHIGFNRLEKWITVYPKWSLQLNKKKGA